MEIHNHKKEIVTLNLNFFATHQLHMLAILALKNRNRVGKTTLVQRYGKIDSVTIYQVVLVQWNLKTYHHMKH